MTFHSEVFHYILSDIFYLYLINRSIITFHYKVFCYIVCLIPIIFNQFKQRLNCQQEMSLASVYEFKYPSQEQLCKKHRLATRIWKGITDQNQFYQICECCGRKVGQPHIQTDCCYYSDQLSFLGVGLPLFFSFLRYSILLLIVLTAVFCVFGLYTNIISKSCQDDTQCQPNIFNTLSIINKKNEENYLSIQNYILLTFVVVCIGIFQFFRYRFRRIVDEIDQYSVSPGDYSIIIKRLPEDTEEKDIYDMIEQRRGFLDEEERKLTNNLKVEKVIMSYDLTEWNEQRSNYLKTFKEMIKHGQETQFQRPRLPKPSVPGLICIVVFTRQQSKQYFISQPKFDQRLLHYLLSPCSPLGDYRIKDERVCIERAPQPDDILWDNANVTVCQGVWRKVVLGLVSVVLLAGGGMAQYGLAIMQMDVEDDKKRILLGTVASVVVSITNLILQYFLIYSTFWQRMSTMTQYTDVVTFKLVFQQFLNSGLFVVGANIAANYQNFNLQATLTQTVVQIMILNAITPNISTFVSYKWDLFGKLMRYCCLTRKCGIYTQLQANYMSILPEPLLHQKYSYIIKTIWLTAFYAPFVPIVVPISIVGLVLNYFIEKYLFSASYSAPNMISTQVNDSCIELFEYVPLILSIGEFLIYLYFKKFNFSQIPINWSVPIYLSIGISLINLIIPMKQVNKCLCKMRLDLSNQPTYTEAEKQFQVTYQLTNPAYQSDRPRLWDVNVWKKLFGHVPGLRQHQMKYYQEQPAQTDRYMQYPFLNHNKNKNYY